MTKQRDLRQAKEATFLTGCFSFLCETRFSCFFSHCFLTFIASTLQTLCSLHDVNVSSDLGWSVSDHLAYLSPAVVSAQCGQHEYRVVRGNDRKALCAVDGPAATHVGDSLSACSSRCSADGNCLFLNYRTPLNHEPICQLYNDPPIHTAVEPRCLLFAVGSLSVSFILRGR